MDLTEIYGFLENNEANKAEWLSKIESIKENV